MKKICLVLTMVLSGYSVFAQNTDKLLGEYITVKDALVAGDSKAAAQAGAKLQQSVKEDDDFSQKDVLLKAVENMAKAGSLEKQRAAFNDVSVSMWKVIKTSGKVAGPVYYQYCPMKKAYWVSKEKQIRNPYYGSSMLTCGKVVETK